MRIHGAPFLSLLLGVARTSYAVLQQNSSSSNTISSNSNTSSSISSSSSSNSIGDSPAAAAAGQVPSFLSSVTKHQDIDIHRYTSAGGGGGGGAAAAAAATPAAAAAAAEAEAARVPYCRECFGDGNSCRVCHHGGHPSTFMMPMTRTVSVHPKGEEEEEEEIFAALQLNNYSFINLNKKFYMRRGEGPFGSLGNKLTEENAAAAAAANKEASAAIAAATAAGTKEHLLYNFIQNKQTATTAANSQTNAAANAAVNTAIAAADTAAAAAAATAAAAAAKDIKDYDLELGLAQTSVPIMQMKDSQYCGMLGIGTPPQWVRPIFDTGSTNLWVVGSDCKDKTCTKVHRYNPSLSSSFMYTNPPIYLDITFGTGRIKGKTAKDNFFIGPFLIKEQTFGLVEQEEANNTHGNIFETINFEGIVGLGFPEMSSTGETPIYDNIIRQNKLNKQEFSFYVAKDSPVSALFFGGVDPRFYIPPINMFPVVREHYWEIALDAIYVGNVQFCCNKYAQNNNNNNKQQQEQQGQEQAEKKEKKEHINSNSYVILDSGTSFNTMPSTEMAQFLQMVPPRECGDDDSFLASYPDITYVIGGVEFVLHPADYLVRSKNNICRPAYMQIDVPSDYGHAYILGSLGFMRHFYTVFRRSDGNSPSLVGIARAVHSEENRAYLEEMMNNYPMNSINQAEEENKS